MKISTRGNFSLWRKMPPQLLKIMKLTAIFLLAFFMQVSARSFSQVTLSLRNASVEKVFREVERQTGIGFLYTKRMVKNLPGVTISVKNASVAEILNECFDGQSLEYSLDRNTIIITRKVISSTVNVVEKDKHLLYDTVSIFISSQSEITGKVTDQQGVPLGGVSVTVKGTGLGTTTDENGNYEIEVTDDAEVLVFSMVGYIPKEENISEKHIINVTLQNETTSLDEVVLIGYGSVKKSDLTGAVSSISSKDLGDRQAPDVASLINGRASGVQVSQGKIRVRGVTTLNNTDPLIVIDGLLGGDLSTVNPSDIENIEILKDASSTAIYGSRGANGVILITTKSGKKGPLKMNLNSWSGIKSTTNRRPVLNADQYIDYVTDALNNAGQTIPPKLQSPEVRKDVTDWQDQIFKTGFTSETNLSFSGGTDKTSYLLSLGHRIDNDIVIGPKSRSTYLRFKNDFNIKSWLDIGADASLSYRVDKGTQPSLRLALGYMPYKEIYDENEVGGLTDVDRINDASDASNPLASVLNRHPVTNTLPFQGQLRLRITPFEGLTFTVRPGIKGSFQRTNLWVDEYINASNITVNQMAESSSYSLAPIIESYINYSKNIKNHSFSALLGNTWEKGVVGGGLSLSAKGYATNEIKAYSIGTSPDPPIQNIFHDSRLSYFGRLNYDYRSKYLLTVNLRADASPNFSPSNRWARFPSVSVGWKISDESFMKGVDKINLLKLRAGWGLSGNDAIGQYRYQSNIYMQGSGYPLGINQAFAQGASIVQNNAPNIKWETTESLTFGIDFTLFDNTLTGTLEYFSKKTRDILFPVPSPLSLGYGAGSRGAAVNGDAIVNAASVENSGIEFQIGKRGTLGQFHYSLDANYTFVKNRVTSLGLGQPFLSGVSRTEIGFPIGYFYGYIAEGVYMTQSEINNENAKATEKGWDQYDQPSTSAGDVRFKDINQDGRITADDRTKIGNPIPVHAFGLNIGIDYRQFDFNMFWQGLANVDMYSEAYKWNSAGVRIMNQESNVLNRWRSESQPGNGIQPRALSGDGSSNTRPSSLEVQDASFLRLKLLSVGYSFPNRIIENWGIDRFRLYISSENLVTITGYNGFDPEVGGDNLVRGVTDLILPAARTVVFGIQLGL